MADQIPMIIGDERVASDESIEVHSPFDGSLVATVAKGNEGHLDKAVAIAKALHDGGPLPAHQRATILDKAGRALAERVDEFAAVISAEAAKPIKTARVEATRAVDTFNFSAAMARTLGGELIPLDASSAGEGKVGFVKRVPIGVIAGISPFNFPLNLVCHKVAPAIAAGCPVVLKPASATPLSALKLAELLIDECDLPPGWLNVVPCAGSTANHLVEHPDVAMITFTGSPDVGWGIRGRAARKKVGLELGNNAPVIIEPDGDWETAAAKIKVAGFSHAGQSCISTQRIYVHESVAGPFTEKLVQEVEALVVGDPADESTDVSALIDPGETERVKSWIEEATAGGAKVLTGGDLTGDGLLRPTVLGDVTDDMKVCALEVFGPVVAVATYTDYEDALTRANDHALRPAGGGVHEGPGQGPAGRRRARLRRRAGQRGPHLAGRPHALRRRPRQRQHPRGPALRRPRDDRTADDRPPTLSVVRKPEVSERA